MFGMIVAALAKSGSFGGGGGGAITASWADYSGSGDAPYTYQTGAQTLTYTGGGSRTIRLSVSKHSASTYYKYNSGTQTAIPAGTTDITISSGDTLELLASVTGKVDADATIVVQDVTRGDTIDTFVFDFTSTYGSFL